MTPRISNERLSDLLASWEHMPPDSNTCADIAVDLQAARNEIFWERDRTTRAEAEVSRLAITLRRALAVIEGPPTMNPDRVPTAIAVRNAIASADAVLGRILDSGVNVEVKS